MTHHAFDPPRFKRPRRRRAMILILVLVVVALLTLAGLTFAELMLAERRAAHLAVQRSQARALAESGVDSIRLFIAQDELTLFDQGGWYDNPNQFQGMLVIDDTDPRGRGRFTVVSPYLENEQYNGIRFGLEDESTRLNLNILTLADEYEENGGRKLLKGLPGMDDYKADAILDWIDADDDRREYGAEREDYANLDPPYVPKNGPLETIEELLLVRDVTPWLLFGVDANRNGYADANEPSPDSIPDVDNSDRSMDRGWAAYLTLYSLELNLNPDGEPKIDLNQEEMETLHQELEEVFDATWATFIVAYRQNGPYDGDEEGEQVPSGTIDLSTPAKVEIATVLDLIGAKVQVQYEGQERPVVLQSPFQEDALATGTYLSDLMDYVAVNTSDKIPGRININQAPRVVLEGIPGIDLDIISRIIADRQIDPADADSDRRHETWILSQGIVTLDQMKTMMPFVCAGGAVYRAQVVGYFDEESPCARLEVVIDATTSPGRVVFWRDIGHLGRGYPLDVLGRDTSSQ